MAPQIEATPTTPPSPFAIQTPTAFLNPAPNLGPSLYGHDYVAPSDDPVTAFAKAIMSTVVLCFGFWFATLLYVISLLCFFPYAFKMWEGNSTALPGLGISCIIALLMALWIGDQTSWSWGVLAFFFLPVVYAVYVYKQNRGMLTRAGRPVAKFPTLVTIGAMVGFGILCLIVGIRFLSHNYGDEISRGDPPFDWYSSDTRPPEQPVQWAVVDDGPNLLFS